VGEDPAEGRPVIEQTGVKCSKCGDRIFSNSRHDFNWCKCNSTFVDGGFDYVRAGGNFAVGDDGPVFITRRLKAKPKHRFRQGREKKQVWRI
jgi:DNA-directed RNA polymerase subunit RPC12/RpoP